MKLDRQFRLICLTAFALSLIQQLIQIGYEIFLRQQSYNYSPLYGVISMIFTYSGLAVSPVLVFVIFYFIGKKTDLARELKATIVALIVGNMAAHVVGTVISEVTMPMFTPEIIVVLVLASALSGIFAGSLFVALAAIGIAYVRRNKTELAANQSQVGVQSPAPMC